MKNKWKSLKMTLMGIMLFSLVAVGAVSFAPQTTYSVYAANDLEDDLSGTVNSGDTNGDTDLGDAGENIKETPITQDDQDVGNYIKNHRNMTGDQLEKASNTLSPVLSFIGYLVGAGIIIIIAWQSLQTVLDLIYITIPPIRNLLYKAGTDGTGGFTGGFGAGGYGRGMMGMGGMGAMGAGGAAGGTSKPTQWVSDEAVQCAAMLGGSANAGNGVGMGGFGMGMGMQQPQQSPVTKQSVIGTYFKKRMFFLLMLVICVLVLTSSAIMGTGVNIAQWLLKVIYFINNITNPAG